MLMPLTASLLPATNMTEMTTDCAIAISLGFQDDGGFEELLGEVKAPVMTS
jgi:hypothetical protein